MRSLAADRKRWRSSRSEGPLGPGGARLCLLGGVAAALLLGGAGCSPGEPWDDLGGDPPPGGDPGPARDGGVQAALPCVTAYACEAKTADTQCGVRTAMGLRAPDLGAPYCNDKRSKQKCSCDVIRCQSAAPLCPGTYTLTVRMRLVGGCDGVPGQLGGSCPAAWSALQLMPQAMLLAERPLLNTDLTWDFADYSQVMTLTGETPARLAVQQYCWFADVSGAGNAGRVEVMSARISQ